MPENPSSLRQFLQRIIGDRYIENVYVGNINPQVLDQPPPMRTDLITVYSTRKIKRE